MLKAFPTQSVTGRTGLVLTGAPAISSSTAWAAFVAVVSMRLLLSRVMPIRIMSIPPSTPTARTNMARMSSTKENPSFLPAPFLLRFFMACSLLPRSRAGVGQAPTFASPCRRYGYSLPAPAAVLNEPLESRRRKTGAKRWIQRVGYAGQSARVKPNTVRNLPNSCSSDIGIQLGVRRRHGVEGKALGERHIRISGDVRQGRIAGDVNHAGRVVVFHISRLIGLNRLHARLLQQARH